MEELPQPFLVLLASVTQRKHKTARERRDLGFRRRMQKVIRLVDEECDTL